MRFLEFISPNSEKKLVTMVDWSDDRIAALSDQDLKNLLVNAERKSVAALIAQCKAEQEKRDAAKPRKASKPRTEVKEFEHEMSGQLATVGKEMAEKYDLSEETAKEKSVGVKGFKAHKLLDAKGYAKLGGMQRDGSVAVDRYISYRRGKDIVSLSVFLLKDQPVEAHEFHVIAPAGHAGRRQARRGNSSHRDGSAEADRRQRARVQGFAECCRGIRRGAGKDHGLRSIRHCEEHCDEAKSSFFAWRPMDCFATLAMTKPRKSEETTMSQSAKRVVLVSRPVGEPKASDFRIEDCAIPAPGEGQVLLRTIWLSLDPYMRGRMSDGPSYAAPVPIGGVMEGGTVSEVIASNNPAFAKGDIVLSRAGWQTHALSDGNGLRKIDPKLGRFRPRWACSACPA